MRLSKNHIRFFIRLLVCITFIIGTLTPQSLFAQDTKKEENKKKENSADRIAPQPPEKRTRDPEDFKQESFPDWAYYGYRYGAVAVGSVPFSILFSTVVYDGYKTYDESQKVGSFQSQYLPLYFSGPDKPSYDSTEVWTIILISGAASISFSTVDLIIQLIKERRGNRIQSIFN